MKYDEDVPQDGYIARLISGGKIENGSLKSQTLQLRHKRKETSYSFHGLAHENKEELSQNWLVRRLFQTSVLDIGNNYLYLVIPVKDLKRRFPSAEVKYDLTPDVFNHVLLYANSGKVYDTEKLAADIIAYLNEDLNKYLYPVRNYLCLVKDCVYSAKDIDSLLLELNSNN